MVAEPDLRFVPLHLSVGVGVAVAMTYSLDFKNCFLIEEGYESGWNNCSCNFHHRGYALVPVSTLYLFHSIFKQFFKWPRLAAH